MTDNRPAEVAYLPPAAPPTNHGHTVAAWTAMIGIMIGTAIGAVGMLPGVSDVVLWLGLVVVVGAMIVGLVLRGLGNGQVKTGARQEPAAR